MVDLYVIEGRQNAGKSALICHLTGVASGPRTRYLDLQCGRTITALVFYSSPNERKPGQSPQKIVDLAKEETDIDAIVLPLRPLGTNGYSSDRYIQALLALGHINFKGYAMLGRGPFHVANPPNPIHRPGMPTPPSPPSNVIAEAVRTHWAWR